MYQTRERINNASGRAQRHIKYDIKDDDDDDDDDDNDQRSTTDDLRPTTYDRR